MPDAICLRIAGSGRSIPISTIVSNRLSISFGLFACPVLKLPSWPVFKACSISSASADRTSPTMMRVSPNNEKVNNFTPETLSIFQSELSCFNVHSE